jgi:hypothetical protein
MEKLNVTLQSGRIYSWAISALDGSWHRQIGRSSSGGIRNTFQYEGK